MGTLSFQLPTGDGAACQVAASMLAVGHLFPAQLSKHHGCPLTASTQELYRVKTKPKIVPVDKDDCRRLVAAESSVGKSLPRLQDGRW